jgi:hypothetical protein
MFNEEERECFSDLSERILQEKDTATLIELVKELQALFDRVQAREKALQKS